ncbi:Alpha/Beta hydrolase protein [Aspergillus spectabilis]
MTTVRHPTSKVDRLKRKLNDTRLSGREIVPGAGERYDWYAIQDQINEYPHYLCTIEDVKIHFLHARAERPDATPLLLVHGWPGSFYEFSRDWGPLSHPETEDDPAFNVVVVSMPGFCWSDWPPKAGWTLPGNARVTWFKEGTGAILLRESWSHTIGIALKGNPIGISMWAGEKYNEAASPENQKQRSWSQAILTTASLYYFTGCIMPSMLCYYENVRHGDFPTFTRDPANYVKVPFGYSSFYHDLDFSSNREVEKTGNLVFYKEYNDGGHFAALECPYHIIRDLRELASQEWKK